MFYNQNSSNKLVKEIPIGESSPEFEHAIPEASRLKLNNKGTLKHLVLYPLPSAQVLLLACHLSQLKLFSNVYGEHYRIYTLYL